MWVRHTGQAGNSTSIDGLTGIARQVSVQPAATSSAGSEACAPAIVTVPSRTNATQAPQIPDSQANGGEMLAARHTSSTVAPRS